MLISFRISCDSPTCRCNSLTILRDGELYRCDTTASFSLILQYRMSLLSVLSFKFGCVVERVYFDHNESNFASLTIILTLPAYPIHRYPRFQLSLLYLHQLSMRNVPGNMGNIPHVDKMMFNRMKQRRLGAVDARSVSTLQACTTLHCTFIVLSV